MICVIAMARARRTVLPSGLSAGLRRSMESQRAGGAAAKRSGDDRLRRFLEKQRASAAKRQRVHGSFY